MTLFGIEWNKMLAAGEAPREDIFSSHTPLWHAARQECSRRIANANEQEKRKSNL